MAQDNTPAIVMYKGPQADGYSIPFDKGFYGEVKVAFVRRGLTDYEYNPTTYSVDGALYAWEISTGVYYYTKSASPAVDATVYNSGNQEISGVTVTSTQNASASFSDGKTGIRSNKRDIHSHALLFWTGEPLGDDDWICIVRETVKKQPYSYPNNQKHIEGALDNLSRQIQELKAQSDISLKVDPTFVQDPQKMNPIDWLNTIVRSTDTTARGLRYRNFWLEYSTDDPNKAESDKSWTKLLNTTNVTTIRQLYNEETNEYYFQYSMDGGTSWLSVGLSKADIDKIIDEANAYSDEQNALLENRINGKLTAIDAQIDANADAIQKTREDYQAADQEIRADMNSKDSELETILNDHAERLATLRTDHDDLGDDVSEIQAKIPGGTSDTNPLINKQQLLDEEMDIREDLNSGLSELQTQITAQAAEIETKQDELIAGDNIIISNNVISATGAGGGAGFDIQVVQELPATGQKGIIYLLAKDGAAPDVYDEYVWIDATQTFELIGTTQVDLSNYLPLSGGTLTGPLTIDAGVTSSEFDSKTVLTLKTTRPSGTVNTTVIKTTPTGLSFSGQYLSGLGDLTPAANKVVALGAFNSRWKQIYVTTLNNGADIEIPTTGGTMALAENIEQAVNTRNLTVGSGEGTLYIGEVAGTATIATNNGLDVAAQTKFDTAPTTDDNTTYADALEVSLIRKAQVATAISDALANVDALPDQTGNAGKFLQTNGDEASWAEVPAGGTKVIIKRYS